MAAINRIESIATIEGIDCDLRRVDGYLFNPPGNAREDLDREYEAARLAGIADIAKVDRAPIALAETGPALRFPLQAQFHPLKYLAGLARAITAGGGRICCGEASHVDEIEGGPVCRVRTRDGRQVRADAVAVCTNASISDYVQTHAKQAPYRTYAIAMSVPRGAVEPALYWDTLDPYHYVRVQPVDDAAGPTKGDVLYDALVVGGEDHRTAHDDNGEERWARLEQWARERWPQVRDVTHRWSGQVLEPADYAAFIGPNPDGAENVYMASGDSGHGITHGTIAGIVLTDLITGKDNPWATVYDPKRVSLRAGPLKDLAKHNVEVAADYLKDWLSPGASPESIPPGEGAVIRRGPHKIAAYRDASGTLHECSAVCTHLKCIVGWNPDEKSWDCPCHGSRFDPMGKVIAGPAITDLEPL